MKNLSTDELRALLNRVIADKHCNNRSLATTYLQRLDRVVQERAEVDRHLLDVAEHCPTDADIVAMIVMQIQYYANLYINIHDNIMLCFYQYDTDREWTNADIQALFERIALYQLAEKERQQYIVDLSHRNDRLTKGVIWNGVKQCWEVDTRDD